MNSTELLVGLAILVGVIGVVVPVLPGSLLILGAVLVWALLDGSGTAWTVFAVATEIDVHPAATQHRPTGTVTNRRFGRHDADAGRPLTRRARRSNMR